MKILNVIQIYFVLILLLSSCLTESQIEVKIDSKNFGDSNSSDSPSSSGPTPAAATAINLLSLGSNGNSCAIDSSGALFCWGVNFDSDDSVQGLLGTNVAANNSFNTLQAVDSGTSYKTVTMGEFINCGVTTSNEVKCWGSAYSSGTPSDSTDKLVPTDIEDSSGDSYIYVDAGSYHICAITSDYILKCWGNNWDGTLGRSSNDQYVLESDSGTNYYQVSGGRNHTCGITTANKLKCFGNNNHGQIGNGAVSNTFNAPQIIDSSEDYKFVTATEDGTCAITTNNKLKCWGNNSYGRLGNNTASGNISSPELIDGTDNYKMVDLGTHHTCAITTSNKLKCWGRNHVGQLGTGSVSADVLSPVLVDGANDYKEVAVGGGWGTTHTCALRTNGDLRCWGDNGYGQLGLGDNIDRTSGPVDVQINFN